MIDWEKPRTRYHLWEWKIPLFLFLAGLAGVLAWALNHEGQGLVYALCFVALIFLFYIPGIILAMYLTASILKVSFGLLGPALLKMGGLVLCSLALNLYAADQGWILLGWLGGLVLTYLVFSRAFDFEFTDTFLALALITFFRWSLEIPFWIFLVYVLVFLAPSLGLG